MTGSHARSRDRLRRIFLTSASSIFARGIGVLSVLISTPITLRYLGPERFGLWATLSSFTALLSFADLGIGNGLINKISDALGREDRAAIKGYVSTAALLFLAIGLSILLVFAGLYRAVDWASVLGVVTPSARQEVGPALAVLVACFAVNIPLGLVARVHTGLQEGYINHLWTSLGGLLSLVAIVVLVMLEAGLPWLVGGLLLGPILAQATNALFLFRRHPDLRPDFHARSDVAHDLLGTGLMFFILQVAAAVAFASDNIVIARVLGPAAVAEYAVPMRLMVLGSTLVSTFLGPLWPAYAEARARQEIAWMKKTFTHSLQIAALIPATLGLVLIIVGPTLIPLWAGGEAPSRQLLFALAFYNVATSVSSAYAILLNATNIVRLQALTGSAMAVSAVALKIVLARHLGVSGVAWGTSIALLVGSIIPFMFYVPKIFERKDLSATHP